jgi:uncharacterized protein (DUF1778 family)
MNQGSSPHKRPQHRRNQTEPVLLRLEPDHLELITSAARHMGLARASWIRSTLLQAARGVLREGGGSLA